MQIRQTELRINLSQLKRNFQTIRKTSGSADLLLVLKSDGYGHSVQEIAKYMDRLKSSSGLHGFGVANVEEGIELRRAKIKRPIYILSGIQQPTKELYRCLSQYRLVPVATSLRVLRSLARLSLKYPKPLKIHVKFNTGMNRLGLNPNEADEAIKVLKKHPKLLFDGIMSHYAAADKPLSRLTKLQTNRFRAIVNVFREKGLRPAYVHMANSFGIENQTFPEGNLVRVGLHLFGEGSSAVVPVAQWEAQVYEIRTLQKGESIGYGPIFRAKKKMRVAILGVGYADGYPRSLSNKADILIKGKRCRVVGAVSMDLTAVDITNVSGVSTRTKAVLLGKNGKERITAMELSGHAKCIPWEIFTGISSRVPRVFLK